MISIKVMGKNGTTIAVSQGIHEAILPLRHTYEEGDRVLFETDEKPGFLVLQPDDALGESLVYVTGNVEFTIPCGEKKICYSPKTFSGDSHLLTARYASAEEVSAYRNLAQNRMDQGGQRFCYPHASANVETRGESVFAARNAIDGVKANHSHGYWPYGSWGINQDPNAQIRVDFGREVIVDKIVIYLRADFPHDSWWKQVTVRFSDGSTTVCRLEKTDQGQEILIGEKKISWIQLEKLIRADDPSPFPALTQLEVYGKEAE